MRREEVAGTIMAHLPPTGWGDLATTQDVEAQCAQLERVLTLHIESTAHQLRTEMSREGIKIIVGVVVAMLGQPFVQAAASHIR